VLLIQVKIKVKISLFTPKRRMGEWVYGSIVS
jgi:hypothetical protein